MKRTMLAYLVGLVAVAFALHCESPVETGNVPTDPDHGDSGDSGDSGPSPSNTDTGYGTVENESDSETITCDAQDISIDFVPTRLVILTDFSGSMTQATDLLGVGKSKWVLARTALTSMLNNPANAAIEFGFDGFPMDANDEASSCRVRSQIFMDTAPNQQATLVQSLQGLSPYFDYGMTPLCKAMLNYDLDRQPNYAPKFMAAGAQLYLLIVTDGEDTCGDESNPTLCGSPSSITAAMLRDRTKDALNHGIHTYVIGFGGAGSLPGQLNAMAAAGGTERKTYINVKDQTTLQTALDSIAATVASCTFTIDKPDAAADPEKVNFQINGQSIGRDDACALGGWRWTEQSDAGWKVEFCGASCEQIKAGGAGKVSAVFGCPTIPIR